MDQIKIGKFIADRRKDEGLTQMQLAERLGVTDRAVSKWERGICMPDSSIMLLLCDTIKITVNDLLRGEVVTMENYNKEIELSLIEAVKEKEASDKRLLLLEVVAGILCIAVMLTLCLLAAYAEIEDWLRVVIILIGLVPVLVIMPFMIGIEQKAGYYKCRKCGHTYVPDYSSVLWSMHFGRTRYMRCPRCEKHSWQKKVISKDQ